MSSTFDTIAQFRRMLLNLDQWIEKAVAHAQAKQFDPDILAASRLAPDQFSLVQQVQAACDAAKYAAGYMSGTQAPSHPDTEKTIAELRQRIAKCVGYLDGFKADDFGPAEQRQVSAAWMEGNSVRGDLYMNRLSIPNFYFHVTTAYAILRHNGVELGKADFIGVKSFTDFSDW